MWNEAIVTYVKVLSQHSLGRTEENYINTGQGVVAEFGTEHLQNKS
jgi:hypothetical protein